MMQTGWHCINKLQIFVTISRYVHIAETCFSKCLRRRNNYWIECIGMYISESNLWQNKNYILFDREEREEGTFLAGRQGIASWNSGLLIRSCVIVNLSRNVVLVRVWMMSMRWRKGSRKVKHASFFISLLCDSAEMRATRSIFFFPIRLLSRFGGQRRRRIHKAIILHGIGQAKLLVNLSRKIL